MESRQVLLRLFGMCLLTTAIAGCTQEHATTQPIAIQPAESREGPEPPTLLDQRIDSVAFADTPLEQAIQTMRDKTSQNIYVSWRALEQAGVKRDTPVTLRLHDVNSARRCVRFFATQPPAASSSA